MCQFKAVTLATEVPVQSLKISLHALPLVPIRLPDHGQVLSLPYPTWRTSCLDESGPEACEHERFHG